MKEFNLSGYNLQTKIYLCVITCLSIAAFGLTVFKGFSLTFFQFGHLAISIVIAILVNMYQFKFPGTRAKFPTREIISFWGIVWFGIPGGVLLALSSSLASRTNYLRDKRRWLLSCLTSVVSVSAAAIVFYLFLGRLTKFSESFVAENEVEIGWFLAALVLAALTQQIVSTLCKIIFYKLESEYTAPVHWKDAGFFALIKCATVTGATILTYLLFVQFGAWFSLVILPTVFLAHLAYRVYLQSLAQKTKQISEANRIHVATVEALATAIDARDQVGIGHVRRTQIYAVGIGKVLDLPEDEIESLRTGALLHDIGKLAVPDHILNKPGRLTPAEMEKMKIHATVGAAILEKINFPYPVIPTVKYHHEMWDGSGYPEGLKREDIPLTARILAVADAYDTLRGARPYRAPVSREEARRFLLNGAGTQFDPRLTDIFLRNLRKFELEIDAQNLSYDSDCEAGEELSGGIEASAVDANQSYIAQIKRANREVFALYELARIFSSSLSLEETLSLFVKKIGELVPFQSCVVYLADKNQETAYAAYAEGQNAKHLMSRQIKAGEGATGYVLKKRQPAYNINPALDFSFYQMDFIQDYTAMASLPLITEENLVGAVSLYSCELENYEDEHMRLLETISRIAADAIFKSLQHADAESRALTDPMTNLPNARNLQLQFETEVARARRNGTEFQVLMLDLDGFKAVNDTFGHKTGDLLLKEISKVMRAQLRDYDFLARYAGDEFVVIAPETTEKDVQDLCERLETAVRGFTLPVGEDNFARVGVSLGAAGYPNNGESLDQIIIAADKAMYNVKAQHKQKKKAEQAEKIASEAAAKEVVEPIKIEDDLLIVELDESHIISSAIN